MSVPYLPLHSNGPLPPSLKASHITRLRYLLLLIFICASTVLFLHLNGYSPLPLLFTESSLSPLVLDPEVVRIQALAYELSPAQRPECKWSAWHKERYTSLENSANVFLAMNLHNNQDVLPIFFQELPLLLQHLGTNRVYVSIYENGSGDKTPELLSQLSGLLEALGVPHRIITEGTTTPSHKDGGNRINFLAAARNLAMEPLYSGEVADILGGHVDEVLWINDVFHCKADILEILHQKRSQGAHQACATDWGVWGNFVIYDRWVLRPMSGRVMYHYDEIADWFTGGYSAEEKLAHLPLLLPEDLADRMRIQEGLPLQVFSCWNGATVFDATAFLPPNNIRFRISHSDLDENGVQKEVSEKASECFLSSVDLWKHNMGRILLVPKASVAYSYGDYEVHRKDAALPLSHNASAESVDWIAEPPKQVAMQDNANWWGQERWASWNEQ